ncbi:MAG: hypothetical protein ABUT39_02395 [Acidobacteriota bacterium]
MLGSLLLWAFVATVDPIVAGEIQIEEVSGVAFLPGDRLLVVADDPHPDPGPVVFLLENAAERLKSGKVRKEDFKPVELSSEVKDLEDVAWDRQSSAFLVTSHSLNKDGQVKPKRSVISRLALQDFKQEKLPELQIPAEFAEARKLKTADGGFNIEGAAWSRDGHLLLGLRAPTDATTKESFLLEIEKPASSPFTARVAARLNLKGNGIRGMFYDPGAHGLWIVAGVSPDLPDGQVKDWALWFRQDDGKLTQITTLPKEKTDTMINAEAVTRIEAGGASFLLVVEDGATVSHYLLFPVPQP